MKPQYFDVDKEMAWYKDGKNDSRLNKIQHKPHKGRKVNQYDKRGEFITCHWSVLTAAEIIGVTPCSIRQSIRGKKGCKVSGGYYWEYVDQPRDIQALVNTPIIPRRRRAVIKLDISGNQVKVFDSVKDAASDIRVDKGVITKCCQGIQLETKGFKYKYA